MTAEIQKIINATEARIGTNILINDKPFTVKKIDVSKTGKHGHAKVRIEAAGITTPKKEVFVVPGHEKFKVPIVNKNKGQVLSITDNKASVMDVESFETLEIDIPEELQGQIEENSNVEYWEIGEERIIKRKL